MGGASGRAGRFGPRRPPSSNRCYRRSKSSRAPAGHGVRLRGSETTPGQGEDSPRAGCGAPGSRGRFRPGRGFLLAGVPRRVLGWSGGGPACSRCGGGPGWAAGPALPGSGPWLRLQPLSVSRRPRPPRVGALAPPPAGGRPHGPGPSRSHAAASPRLAPGTSPFSRPVPGFCLTCMQRPCFA